LEEIAFAFAWSYYTQLCRGAAGLGDLSRLYRVDTSVRRAGVWGDLVWQGGTAGVGGVWQQGGEAGVGGLWRQRWRAAGAGEGEEWRDQKG